MRQLPLLVLALALAAAACSPVSNVQLRSDYETVDRTQTVRIAVAVAPLPAEATEVAVLWARMAQNYVNHHRDFLVLQRHVGASLSAAACAPGNQGVLYLAPSVKRVGSEVTVAVKAHLKRCADNETIWRADGLGQWPSDDDQLVEVRRRYAADFGAAVALRVAPYIAPSWRLLRVVLAELPRPKLTRDEDVMEKIELQ